VFTRDQPPGYPGGAVTQGKLMEEPAHEPHQSTARAKLSEATGQAILLTGIAWSIFSLVQAPWYMARFNVHPLEARWIAVTLVTGAVPPLLVLLFAFLGSWLVGAIRGRADPWRSYRDGLIVASVFTLLVNFGLLLVHRR
jgi:hypothetical protein